MGCEGSGGADETEEVCASVEALRELEGLARQQQEAGLMVRAGEGGIYAAMWKLLKARRLGAEYSQRAIPILQQTIEICETWSLDPYRLDSAGRECGSCRAALWDSWRWLREHTALALQQLWEGP